MASPHQQLAPVKFQAVRPIRFFLRFCWSGLAPTPDHLRHCDSDPSPVGKAGSVVGSDDGQNPRPTVRIQCMLTEATEDRREGYDGTEETRKGDDNPQEYGGHDQCKRLAPTRTDHLHLAIQDHLRDPGTPDIHEFAYADPHCLDKLKQALLHP